MAVVLGIGARVPETDPAEGVASAAQEMTCPSRIRSLEATGSWTRSAVIEAAAVGIMLVVHHRVDDWQAHRRSAGPSARFI